MEVDMKAGKPPVGIWPRLMVALMAVGAGCTLPPPQGSPGGSSGGGGASQGSYRQTYDWIGSYKGVADIYHYESRDTEKAVPLTVEIAWTDVSSDRTHLIIGGDEGRTSAWVIDVPVRDNPSPGSAKYRTVGQKDDKRYTCGLSLSGDALTGTILVETLRARTGPILYEKITGTFYK
jgi:hypothetical protein